MYLGMQTFAIPGTLSLSLLAGALYGSLRGWLVVSLISTLGSSSCYLMSRLLGRPLVAAWWPEKLEFFAAEVQKRRSKLFNYIIFLRLTPILPNTFINVASPLVDVPLLPFFLGTPANMKFYFIFKESPFSASKNMYLPNNCCIFLLQERFLGACQTTGSPAALAADFPTSALCQTSLIGTRWL